MFRRPPPKLARFIRLFIYSMAMPVTAVLRATDAVRKFVKRSRRDDTQEAESIEETALADYHKEHVALDYSRERC